MIKVTLGAAEETPKGKPFPKLMICTHKNAANKGMVVLFSNDGAGTVIANPSNWQIGQRNTNWCMDHFTDYNEPITIQNA